MTDKTQTPASDAATPATTQPTAPVETEDTPMTEPKPAAPDPKVAASETRAQPKTQATPAPDTEAVATRAREAEREKLAEKVPDPLLRETAAILGDAARLLDGDRALAAQVLPKSSAPGNWVK